MKAQERHKLKTNELAESLSELPEYLRTHSTQIITVAVIVLVVAAAGYWWWHGRVEARQGRLAELQLLVVKQAQLEQRAAQQGQLESKPGEEPKEIVAYDAAPVAAALRTLAEEAGRSPVGMSALLQEAQAIRSQLFFSDQPITDEEKERICQRVENIYQRLLQEYPQEKLAVGMARMGQGLVAEDRGDWAKAKEIYQAIIADGKDKLAGTIFGRQAQDRLDLLSRIDKPIEFALAPSAPVSGETQEPAAPAPAAEPVPQAPLEQ